MSHLAVPARPDASPACQRPTVKYPNGRTGLPAGYDAHRTAGEPPCSPCGQAHKVRCSTRHANRAEDVRAAERLKRNEAANRWRRANPELARALLKRYWDEGDRIVKEAKARPCADCGIQYASHVMQFDHLGDKEFSIGQRGRNLSRRRLLAEIQKCEVVCANCHAERTYQRAVHARKAVCDGAEGTLAP